MAQERVAEQEHEPAAAKAAAAPDIINRLLAVGAVLVLLPVALIGAVLSYSSMYHAALPIFGRLAVGFPIMVDAGILGASLAFVAGARQGKPRTGWRLMAHGGVAATVALNAMAATAPSHIPWHIAAPAMWAVIVELTAQQFLQNWRSAQQPMDRIPLRLWISAPVESVRSWLVMARTSQGNHVHARRRVGTEAAAREALRLTLPGRSGRGVRKVLTRQLRAGALAPHEVLGPLGWGADGRQLEDHQISPHSVLRAVLAEVLMPDGQSVGPGKVPTGWGKSRPVAKPQSRLQPVAPTVPPEADTRLAHIAVSMTPVTAAPDAASQIWAPPVEPVPPPSEKIPPLETVSGPTKRRHPPLEAPPPVEVVESDWSMEALERTHVQPPKVEIRPHTTERITPRVVEAIDDGLPWPDEDDPVRIDLIRQALRELENDGQDLRGVSAQQARELLASQGHSVSHRRAEEYMTRLFEEFAVS